MPNDKIPVKIIQVEDKHGNKQVGVMLDISYYSNVDRNPSQRIAEFEKEYFETLKKAKKIYKSTAKKRGKNTKFYWELSNILRQFNEKIDNEFVITNYASALERDFGLTDSYVRVFLDFIKFFKEDEVLPAIPMSIYFELTIKKRKLDKIGIFDREKRTLLENAKKGKIPDHKYYRQYLAQLVKEVK